MRLVDWQITSLQKQHRVIRPFEAAMVTELPEGAPIPYGLARDGYVLRLSTDSALSSYRVTVDPKGLPRATEVSGLSFVPAHSALMSLSVESVGLPQGYFGWVELLPEYATCGLILVSTPLLGEAPSARVALTLVNPLSVPVQLYHSEGVAKLVIAEAPFPSRAEEIQGLGNNGRGGRGRELAGA